VRNPSRESQPKSLAKLVMACDRDDSPASAMIWSPGPAAGPWNIPIFHPVKSNTCRPTTVSKNLNSAPSFRVDLADVHRAQNRDESGRRVLKGALDQSLIEHLPGLLMVHENEVRKRLTC
jgi:hypothetical protein